MSLAATDIETPATDLDTLELLAHHLRLAQVGRLEELFEGMQRFLMPWDALVSAQVCALSVALWSLRRGDIEQLGNETLSLFGLRGFATRSCQSWIEPVFQSEFPKALSSGLSLFHHSVQEGLWVPQPLALGRLLVMTVPDFALQDIDAMTTPEGSSLTEHLVGENLYGEFGERCLPGLGMLPRPDQLALEVCQQTLREAQKEHGYASLPAGIDREALAASVRAKLEAELGPPIPEDCDIPF